MKREIMIMSTEFTLDWERKARTGIPEAVISDSKTPRQLDAIASVAAEQGRRMLFTRLSPEQVQAMQPATVAMLDYDPASRTAFLGGSPTLAPGRDLCIVSAGTSDSAVSHEARRTAAFLGIDAPLIQDVGVAGLWRLMARIEEIRSYRVIIAVAGMEGALFSVLAGLVDSLLIAVPTSTGYGVSQGGRAALNSALASCSPGIVTVNVDNGFGAACAAMKALRIGQQS